jgi:polyhydroxyalkanoate synthesis regulator phasin
VRISLRTVDGGERKDQGGISESLREAIERTFTATAQTRDRAGELLDEVARRGQEAREAVTQRTQEAQEASASMASRVVEAIESLRLASRDDVRELESKLAELSKRVAALESTRGPDSKVEG